MKGGNNMASVNAIMVPDYSDYNEMNIYRNKNRKNYPQVIKQKINNINPSLIAAKTVAVGTATAAGLKAGRTGGVKFANWVEKNVVDFTKDFVKEEGGKVGFKKAVEKLPKVVKNSISWGIGGAVAFLTAMVAFKDSDGDGQFDIVEAVRKFLQPDAKKEALEAEA